MELKSRELFEAVKKEYPELSASEIIAFVQAEYLAHIAENMNYSANNSEKEYLPALVNCTVGL